MSKFLLKDVKVMVGTVDLSSHAFNVDTPGTKEQVDVSGFSTTGSREFLPGLADESIVIQFENDFAASQVHATLEPLYRNGTTTLVYVVPTSAAVSATNPAFGGQGVLFDYNGLSGALNARSETTATFKPAPGGVFQWAATAPTATEAEAAPANASSK
jgi:hypothetical protein